MIIETCARPRVVVLGIAACAGVVDPGAAADRPRSVDKEGVVHAKFSRYDNPGRDMYRLDSILDGAIGFTVMAQSLPQGDRAGESELPDGRGRQRCDYDFASIRLRDIKS